MSPVAKRQLKPFAVVGVCVLAALLIWQVAAQLTPGSLAPAGAVTPPPPGTFPAFTNLPVSTPPTTAAATPSPADPRTRLSEISPGTAGRTLTPPAYRSGTVFAILGDRTLGDDTGQKYLAGAVQELNALRPDLVLTVGDFVEGYTRSGEEYAHEAAAFRATADQLAMPWYPCAGNHDVMPGTRDPQDHRFEELYQKYFGPLYYSLDYADLHFIVLYANDQLAAAPALSEAQLAWLKNDLNRAFEARRTQGAGRAAHVFVLLHEPLWRDPKSNWSKVHEMLVEFNRRPIVSVEGPGNPPPVSPPHVDAVFAGHVHAYTQDPPKDGIVYYVLGPTGGRLDQDALTGQLQHYTVVKVDATGPQFALIEPGSVHAEDYVTARDRDLAAKIAAFDNDTIGIEGLLEQPVNHDVGNKDQNSKLLTLNLKNPLDVPIDISIRLSSARFLTSATAKDDANLYTDNYDSPWQLFIPYVTQHLEPHQKLAYWCAMFCPAQPGEVAPPQVEFIVSFTDSKGRSVPTLLKRRVPLIPSAGVTIGNKAPAEADWDDAVSAGTYAWVPSIFDRPVASPEFQMVADGSNFYIKVRADASRFSYYPDFTKPGDLPCDAVAVAFAPSASSLLSSVQRIVVFPFAPNHPLLMTNTGVGAAQTALLPLDTARHAVSAAVTRKDESYELVIAIPRAIIFGRGDGAVMNLTVTDNADSAFSTTRSWAREDVGPKGWARVKLIAAPAAAPPPASAPATATNPVTIQPATRP